MCGGIEEQSPIVLVDGDSDYITYCTSIKIVLARQIASLSLFLL